MYIFFSSVTGIESLDRRATRHSKSLDQLLKPSYEVSTLPSRPKLHSAGSMAGSKCSVRKRNEPTKLESSRSVPYNLQCHYSSGSSTSSESELSNLSSPSSGGSFFMGHIIRGKIIRIKKKNITLQVQ